MKKEELEIFKVENLENILNLFKEQRGIKSSSPSKNSRGGGPSHKNSNSDEPHYNDRVKDKGQALLLLEQNLNEYLQKVALDGEGEGSLAISTADDVPAASLSARDFHENHDAVAGSADNASSSQAAAVDVPAIIEPSAAVSVITDDLNSIPSCVIPVNFSNTAPVSVFHPPSSSQFIDADSSILNSGRDLCRTSKTRNLLIKSPSATKSLANLQLVATSSAHAESLNLSISSKSKMPSTIHGFSAMSGLAPTPSISQTPSHYYASPFRNETPFSPIKRRKLFNSSLSVVKLIPGAAHLDEQFEELPVFVHVAPRKVLEQSASIIATTTAPSTNTTAPSTTTASSTNDLFKIPMNPLTATAFGSGDSMPQASLLGTPSSLPATSTLAMNQPSVSENHYQTSQPSVAPAVESDLNSTVGYNLLATKLKIASKGLCSVLPKASKVVTTRDWRIAQDEVRTANVLLTMEKLKEQNLWSFKQIKAQVHPPRPKVQWDYMIEEMMWMSEDFRQERRWKIAAAYNVSRWVLEWHATSDKSLVCVRISAPGVTEESSDIIMLPSEDLPASVLEKAKESKESASAWRPGSTLDDSAATEDSKVKGIDPKSIQITAPLGDEISSFPITIDLSSNTYLLSSSAPMQSGLSHIESYMCPVFNSQDLYKENEEQIVPVSKFMLSRYHVPNPRVSSDFGRPESKQARSVRGNGNIYLNQLTQDPPKVPSIASLFLPVVDGTCEGADVQHISSELFPPPPGITRPDTTTAAPGWTGDEEDALWQFAYLFNGNWSLVVDSLNGIRVGNSGKRSVWCCFDKYIELANGSFKPHSNVDYLYAPSQSNKKDRKVKALGVLSTFNFIIGLAKRRDDTRPRFSKPNKPVNLAAHSTHLEVKLERGIDPRAPPLRPIELSRLKEQRDLIAEQSRQAVYQHGFIRQPAIGSNMSRPMMPNNYRPARPMNPQQQQPLQQQQQSHQQQQQQLLQHHNMGPFAVQQQMGNFRAPFQGSPQKMHQQITGSPVIASGTRGGVQQAMYSAEQLTGMSNNRFTGNGRPMTLAEQQLLAQGLQFNQVGPSRMMQNRPPPQGIMQQIVPGRTPLNDASTAAAFTALQNVKQNNVRPSFVNQQQQPELEHHQQPLQLDPQETSEIIEDRPPSSTFLEKRAKTPAASAPPAKHSSPPEAKGQGTKSAMLSSAVVNSSPLSRSSKRKHTSPHPPIEHKVEVEDQEASSNEVSTKQSKSAALSVPSEPPSVPLRRTSRLSNPGASQATTAPTAFVAAAKTGSSANTVSLGGSGRQTRASRSKKQPVVVSASETEDDELEGDEEEEELEHTEASEEEEPEPEVPLKKPTKARSTKKGKK